MKLITSFVAIALMLASSDSFAGTFNKTQELEIQFLSLGSTYYSHVLTAHEQRETLIRQIKDEPNADLTNEYSAYLEPSMYNTVVFRLFPDGTATAEMIDPNNHTQMMVISGTYDRAGRNLVIDLDDANLQITTDFVGKSSKADKKCYQGTSESPQPGFPGSFWVTYWEGCRSAAQ